LGIAFSPARPGSQHIRRAARRLDRRLRVPGECGWSRRSAFWSLALAGALALSVASTRRARYRSYEEGREGDRADHRESGRPLPSRWASPRISPVSWRPY